MDELIERLEKISGLHIIGDPLAETIRHACSQAAAELRKVRQAPVVCVAPSAVRNEGWVMFDADGDSIQSMPFKDGQRVRLVRVGGEVG